MSTILIVAAAVGAIILLIGVAASMWLTYAFNHYEDYSDF